MEEVPFDDRRVPKTEIDWERSCWWWHPLTRALHPAVRMSSLFVSLIAIAMVIGGWHLGNWVFKPQVDGIVSPLGRSTSLYSSQAALWIECLSSVLAAALRPMGFREFAFWTFEMLWASLVLSIFGGLLARRAMVELGQRTVAPWFHSTKMVVSRWQSYLWASGMNLVGIAALLLIPACLGLISRLGSGGAWVGGTLLILFFPVVFGIGRFVLSLIICFPLSVCAVSVEKKADAFEGFSRSNAYFFQRPVVAIIFAAGLFAVGYVGEQLVTLTIVTGWTFFRNSYLFGGGTGQLAAEQFVAVGEWLAQSLVMAFGFSYFWAASGALYLVLRRCVDHTELSEIDLAEQAIGQELPEIPAPPVKESHSPDTQPMT